MRLAGSDFAMEPIGSEIGPVRPDHRTVLVDMRLAKQRLVAQRPKDLAVISGYLPRRALALAREWAELHQGQLRANWIAAERRKPLQDIEPLE